MCITFYGGAGSVTGANYLLESGGFRLMVDCGLIQGGHFAERENFQPFAFQPRDINALLVTHAHLDHVGRLPKLVGEGFRGSIYSTPPTRDLAELILIDSEHVLCKEAEREASSPLCSIDSVDRTMQRWLPLPYHQSLTLGPFNVEFFDAGHILGSAFIQIRSRERTIVFSGDLGNSPAPIVRSTEPMPEADHCVVESAYGDRVHEREANRQEDLEQAVRDTIARRGTLLIPTFALERTQEILYHLNEAFEHRGVPRVPVFLDSPLAIKMTAVYKKYENYFNREASSLVRSGDDILNFPGLRLTLTTEQSKDINNVPPPKIIIAGSGMSQGGRILHHELRYLPDPQSMILFVGYQSVSSLGRQIMEGAPEVHIFGERVPIRCERRSITAYSAHADQPRLLSWLRPRAAALQSVFVVQGEAGASETLAGKIHHDLGATSRVPRENETIELEPISKVGFRPK
ncbi:MAG: MBL fold metallo-hydrolase [Candidatus Liptonbacteria bacterium]|nr:MBL fold metallo-hydrolase [Candidatus Liptonbacteria bacterium]